MHFENGFIKNEKALHESSYVNDLLDRGSEIEKYSIRIDELHQSTIWGIVGQFGTGKSTLINNVKNRRNKEKHSEKRFEFDARKYPDRKDLREGFVLDFARQVDEKEFNKVIKKIDGTKHKKVKAVTQGAGTIFSAFGKIEIGGIISGLSNFFNTSPAKRVFQIQEIFQDLVNKVDEKKIIIVVEDIDRSGDAGIFFLETLKQFISKNEFGKEILIIMPLGTDEYYNHLDSYLKPIDYFDFFNPGTPTLDKFVKEIFVDEIINDKRCFQPLQEFLEGLFSYYPNEINFRKLKMIIRKANQNHIMMYGKYDDLFDLDWRLNLMFEAMKYIGFDDKKNSLFEQLRVNKTESTIDRQSLFGAYIYNLVGLTKRGNGHRYIGDGTSLYESRIRGDNKNKLKTETELPIKFFNKTEEPPKKEIVGRLYDHSNFENNGPHAIIVPYAYLDY